MGSFVNRRKEVGEPAENDDTSVQQVIPKHILMQRDVPAYGIRAANKVLQ